MHTVCMCDGDGDDDDTFGIFTLILSFPQNALARRLAKHSVYLIQF